MTELSSLWEQILEEIKKGVSHGKFVSFFQKSKLLSLQDNVATIGVVNSMGVNILEKHENIIREAIKKHTDIDAKIVYTVHVEHTEENTKHLPLFREEAKEEMRREVEEKRPLPSIRPDYTFDTLAVSESNRLAFVSSQNVARYLGKSYNPLYIYGPVGVGKTHLMQAIANEVYIHNRNIKIIYISSEEFTNEVVNAIRTNNTQRMREKFRKVNLLMIDDIQFFSDKYKVQEELFHTFNTLISNQAQIVLSSDKPPSEIKKLEDRLSSRFAGGLTVDIQSPDFEMRTAIVLKKAEGLGFPLPIEAAKVIAEKQQDVRSLEGALLRVITESKTNQEEVTAKSVASALTNGLQQPVSTRIHPDDVIRIACEFYRLKPTQLKGPKRDASIAKARQVTMYLLRKELRMPLVEIGNLLGGRDHTTVMHGVEKMELSMLKNTGITEEIVGITKMLRG